MPTQDGQPQQPEWKKVVTVEVLECVPWAGGSEQLGEPGDLAPLTLQPTPLAEGCVKAPAERILGRPERREAKGESNSALNDSLAKPLRKRGRSPKPRIHIDQVELTVIRRSIEFCLSQALVTSGITQTLEKVHSFGSDAILGGQGLDCHTDSAA